MLEEVDHHYLLAVGFDGVKISDPESLLKQLRSSVKDAQIQLLKAGLIAGREHLSFAARNALHSFKGTRRKSKSLAVEFLLFVSCQGQISKAIELLGVTKRDRRVALVALSESKTALERLEEVAKSKIRGVQDDGLIEIGSEGKADELRRVYGITSRESDASRLPDEPELDVLKRLVIERSSLVAIDR